MESAPPMLFRHVMAVCLYIQVLWLLPTCRFKTLQVSNTTYLEFFKLNDNTFDNFTIYPNDQYSPRTVQCSNTRVTVNDYSKQIIIICDGSEVNVSDLLNCTGLTRISGIAFVDCRLPTPNLSSLVKDFRLKFLVYLIATVPLTPEEIIVKDLTSVESMGLSIINGTKYTLQNLPNLRSIIMPLPDVDVFPENLLSNLSLLDKVVLAGGRIETIPSTTFRGLSRLAILLIRNNTLKTLPSSLFEGLQLLMLLDLSYNRLESLPSNIFDDLINLRTLSLTGNDLAHLPATIFVNQRSLIALHLSNNRKFITLPEDLFKTSYSLVWFIANNCNLKIIPEKLFSSANGLFWLSLSGNKISSLPTNLFEQNPFLNMVDLSRNHLRTLPETIFRSNSKIFKLSLDSNLFLKIPVKAIINIKSLNEIYLSDNYIVNADEPRLESLKSLIVITLGKNNISSFKSPTPFGKLQHLERIDLSFNNFDTFPSLDWKAYNITTLLMNDNRISNLKISSFPPGNSTIDLRSNKIHSVSLPPKNSSSSHEIVEMYLGSNPFLCDCKLRDFLHSFRDNGFASRRSTLISDAEEMKCTSPPNWKAQNVMQISPLYQLCPVTSLCPQHCRCFRLMNLTVLVNCSSAGFAQLPYTLPAGTTIVHLENNFISEFTNVSMKNWEKVTRLFLNENLLVRPTFWPALNVEYLSLRKNRLTELPEGLKEYIANAPQFLLDIRDNSWVCNCTYLSFKLWLAKHEKKLLFPDEILCNITSLENETSMLYPILKVPDDAFCSLDTASVAVRVIVGVFACCCVCVAVAILIILHFGNRQTFVAYLYAHFPLLFSDNVSDAEKNKPYDAFISYTSSDRDAVLTVLKELEEKPPNFKFCIHERDWLPGYPIISQIESSVQNSKKTIIFLSQQFLDSFWCETELQAAYMQSLEDRVDRLIIVLKGELPEKDSMPLDAQNLLDTKTYLVWGERWFWEKLKYALPHLVRAEKRMKQELIVEGMIQEFRHTNVI